VKCTFGLLRVAVSSTEHNAFQAAIWRFANLSGGVLDSPFNLRYCF